MKVKTLLASTMAMLLLTACGSGNSSSRNNGNGYYLPAGTYNVLLSNFTTIRGESSICMNFNGDTSQSTTTGNGQLYDASIGYYSLNLSNNPCAIYNNESDGVTATLSNCNFNSNTGILTAPTEIVIESDEDGNESTVCNGTSTYTKINQE